MTKRLFAWALVLALVLSMMPVVMTSVAADEDLATHTDHTGWTAWSDATKLPTSAGKFYLTVDVALTGPWSPVAGHTHLCLNGHTVTQNTENARMVVVNATRELSIYDCAPAYNAAEEYIGGKFQGGNNSNNGLFIVARGSSTAAPGKLNLYGGRICGNRMVGTSAVGGAIYVQSGQKNKPGGIVNMYGGEITDNQAKYGGAIALHGETVANRGDQPATFNMYGGKIFGNNTTTGTLYGLNGIAVNLHGGEIVENTASSGACLYMKDALVSMKDVTITENTATNTAAEGNGSTVFLAGTIAKLTIGGNTIVADNTNASGCDIVLNNDDGGDVEKIYVDGLTGGNVRFTVKDTAVTQASQVVVFADPAKTDYADGALTFVDGTEQKLVGLVGGVFTFVQGHIHDGVLYQPWTATDKLPSSGNYYLTANVTLTDANANRATIKSGNTLCLCMNGKTISGNNTQGRAFVIEDGNFFLDDCTTTYDADGYFVSGGKVVDFTQAGSGAALFVNHADAVVEVTGVEFSNNICTGTNADYGGGAMQLRSNTTPAKFTGCLFTENSSKGAAGAIALRQSASIELVDTVITKNSAVSYGAFYTRDSNVTFDGCKITENTASGSISAVYIVGKPTVIFKDTEVSGNTAPSATTYGAIHAASSTAVVKLVGKTIVTGNTVKDGAACNLCMYKTETALIDVTGLTTGANVGISFLKDRMTMAFTTAGMTADNGYCVSDDATYSVELDAQGRLALTKASASAHTHKLCGDAACTDHGNVKFDAWTETGTLPTSGNYYLTANVTLTDAVTVTSSLNLCLNGFTVTQTTAGKRIINVGDGSKAATVSLTDCQTTGKLTGGSATYGSAISVRQKSTFNLFGGTLTGNVKTGSGAEGTIYVQGGANCGNTFNMYGGTITDNIARTGGAISVAAPTSDKAVSASVNILGGTISNNTADVTGGAIHTSGRVNLTLGDVSITGNTAKTSGGAIQLGVDANLTLTGGAITGNTAPKGAGIFMAANAGSLTVSGAPVVTANNSDNLFLDGNAIINLGKLETAAQIGVSAAVPGRAISATTEDYTVNFPSDDASMVVQYKNSVLWLDAFSDHQHCLCNSTVTGCDHSVVMWMPWNKTDSLPTSGNYYLTADVTLTDAVTTANLNLCLNGHIVTQTTAGKRIINAGDASNSVTTSVTDCTGKGELTGGSATYGSAVSIRHNSTFSLYGGKITGNTSTSEGAVYMQGNTPTGNTFNMYGGEISGNTNRAGGAISVGAPYDTVTKLPKVNIYGGIITGNNATQAGGAINLSGAGEVTIAGGEITGNTAGTNGGAINLGVGAKLTLTGGSITDNEANKGAGIYVNANVASITVSGAPVVYGNTAAGKQNNVYLEGNTIFTLGAVESAAKIGVTAVSTGRAISNQSDNDFTANFLGDNSKMPVTYKDKTLWIDQRVETSDHYHCVCDGVVAGTCNGQEQMWIKWGDDEDEIDTLPTTSGYYFLVADIALVTFASPAADQEIYLCLNGKIVTAAENDRHMNVTAGTVYTITDCASAPGGFTGGNRTFGGSVNINAGGRLDLYAGRFFGNNAPNSEGGAIYLQSGRNVDGGVFNMYGGEISGNTALYGGGVRAAGLTTGSATQPSIVNIYGGLITGNSVYKVVTTNATTGKETVTNCNGGGISTQGGSALNVYGGTISDNVSEYDGGGIYTKQSTFVMTGGKITGNKAYNHGAGFFDVLGTVTLRGGTISNNAAAVRGGAFVASGSVMDIYGVTISGNNAKEGGVCYMNRSSIKSNGVVTYYPALVTVHDGALVTGNEAETNTGGFLVANPDVKLVIAGGEISKNKAANGGGFMIWKGATVLMTGGKVTNNEVNYGIGGGGYVSNEATFIMEGGTISNNKARLGGGVYGDRCVLELKGGSISGNYARVKLTWKDGKETKTGGQGAGVYIQGAEVNIRGTSINSNHAESSGGGLVMSRQTAKVNGVQVTYMPKVNMYSGSISYNYSAAAAGGMLVQSTDTVTNVYGGSFVGNKSASNGAGIYVSTKATLNMYGGIIAQNATEKVGGGLFVSQGTANVSNVNFRANEAGTNGAGMVVNGNTCVVKLKNCKFFDHETKAGAAGVIQSRAHLTAENCDFYDNTANASNGGALYVSTRSYADLTGCKFWNNEAPTFGGAMYIANFAVVNLVDSDFTENTTEGQGGALAVFPASKTTVTNTTFNKNSAKAKGGTIFCRGDITMTKSVIEKSTSGAEGGAIAADVNTVAGSGFMRGLVLTDTIFRYNTADGKGGAIHGWKGCRVELHGCTFTGNIAPDEGGAVWAYEDLELHDVVVTDNTSGGNGYAVYMNDANFDGHSYMASKNKLSGNTIIRDNEGGDLYMGPDVILPIVGEGLGKDAYIQLTLDSGVVTHRVIGAYHYEGGNQVYTITYGDRSMTEPELYVPETSEEEAQQQAAAQAAEKQAAEKKAAANNTVLYIGIGLVALVVVALGVVLVAKKKKSGKTPEKANKE